MKSKSNIFLIFLAAFITFLIYYFILRHFNQYELEYSETTKSSRYSNRIFYDFNKDGYSEIINYGAQPESKKEFVSIANNSGKLIGQFNFSGTLAQNGIQIGDVNTDGYDDLIVFYIDHDTLCYDIIDFSGHRKIIDRNHLITKPDSAKDEYWFVSIANGCQVRDLNYDGKNEIIVGLRTGFAIYPRGIYIIEPLSGKIIKKFESNAPIAEIFYTDIDQDKNDEIIAYSYAPANLKELTGYHDRTSWIFIFDESLSLEMLPKSFGNFPEGIVVKPVFIEKLGYLTVVFNNKTSLIDPTSIILLDDAGQYEFERKFPSLEINDLLIYYEYDQTYFLVSVNDGRILKFNQRFEEVSFVQLDVKYLNFTSQFDIDSDGIKEIICLSDGGLYIINSKLEILLYEEIDDLDFNILTFSIKNNGHQGQQEISFRSRDNYYLASVTPSFISINIYVILVVLVFSLSFLFVSSKNLLKKRTILIKGYRYGINNLSDGVLLLDNQEQIFSFNNAVVKIFNIKIESGSSVSTLGIAGSTVREEISSLRMSGKFSETEISGDFSGNEGNYLKITTIPLSILNKINLGFLIIFKELKGDDYPDKFKVWSRSVQKIAHDIKTPLSTVLLNLQTLKIRLDSSLGEGKEECFKDIGRMQSELDRIKNLTKKFLKFVDLETPDIRIVQVNDIIDRSLKRFENLLSPELKFEIDLDKSNNSIYADFNQIELVFHILLENSIDALNGSGILKITSDVYEEITGENNYLQIEVSDNGEGVDSNLLDKIFEPNFTTKKDGTGLGLAMAKRIIENHKGKISAYSRKNFGTTMRFIIPKA